MQGNGFDLVELQAVTHELFGLYSGQSSVAVRAEYERAGPITHGWYTAVRRTGQAALLLDDSGFGHEAAPLRRSMMEHSLGLHWLADSPDAVVDVLLGKHQERVRRLKGAMNDSWTIPISLFDAILDVKVGRSPEETYAAFRRLCERYGLLNLYATWLTETGFSHASYSSASAYFEDVAGKGVALLREAPSEARLVGRAAVAPLLLLASQGFSRLLADDEWTDRLAQLEARLQLALHPQ